MTTHTHHMPSRNQLFHRTEMLLGKPSMQRLAAARVAVFGVGGVGSWAAEALVRSGVEHLMIVDSDTICATNVNRQAQATALNVGRVKTDELKRRLLEINPHVEIDARHMPYNSDTRATFDLAAFDYLVDCIDSLSSKVLLLQHGTEAKITVFSSMGAGAKLDPTRVRVAPLSESSVCPLARAVRKRLGRRGVPRDFLCVYSDEMPRDPAEAQTADAGVQTKRVNGTVVHVTAVFGFTLAGLVVQDAMARATA